MHFQANRSRLGVRAHPSSQVIPAQRIRDDHYNSYRFSGSHIWDSGMPSFSKMKLGTLPTLSNEWASEPRRSVELLRQVVSIHAPEGLRYHDLPVHPLQPLVHPPYQLRPWHSQASAGVPSSKGYTSLYTPTLLEGYPAYQAMAASTSAWDPQTPCPCSRISKAELSEIPGRAGSEGTFSCTQRISPITCSRSVPYRSATAWASRYSKIFRAFGKT